MADKKDRGKRQREGRGQTVESLHRERGRERQTGMSNKVPVILWGPFNRQGNRRRLQAQTLVAWRGQSRNAIRQSQNSARNIVKKYNNILVMAGMAS